MRVSYFTPLPQHYDAVFNNQEIISNRGGGLEDISLYKRRGSSLFSILRGLFKRTIPFLKRLILPEVGSEVNNVTHDVSQNTSLKDSLEANAIKSMKNVGLRIIREKYEKMYYEK